VYKTIPLYVQVKEKLKRIKTSYVERMLSMYIFIYLIHLTFSPLRLRVVLRTWRCILYLQIYVTEFVNELWHVYGHIAVHIYH
jgi:hypothetical protein